MINDLQEVMASLGMQLTESELLDIKHEVKIEKIDLMQFISLMATKFDDRTKEKEEIYEVFKLFDKVSTVLEILNATLKQVPLSYKTEFYCRCY